MNDIVAVAFVRVLMYGGLIAAMKLEQPLSFFLIFIATVFLEGNILNSFQPKNERTQSKSKGRKKKTIANGTNNERK